MNQVKIYIDLQIKLVFGGKKLRPGISRDPVNRGMVYWGFTVQTK